MKVDASLPTPTDQGYKQGLEVYFLAARILDSLSENSFLWTEFESIQSTLSQVQQVCLLVVVALCFKYVEYDPRVYCQAYDLVSLSMPEYRHFLTQAFFVRMEKYVLQHVQYNLQISTLYDYVSYLIAMWDLDCAQQRVLWFLAIVVTQLPLMPLSQRLSLVISLYIQWTAHPKQRIRPTMKVANTPFQPFDLGATHVIQWSGVSQTMLPPIPIVSVNKLTQLMDNDMLIRHVLTGAESITV